MSRSRQIIGLPHGASAEVAASLGDNVLVIDAGADFRLESPSDWAAFYGTPARRITPAVGANAYAREARKEGWEVVDHALAPRAEFFHFLLLFMRRAG